MGKDLISVVITTHNRAGLLKRAIESVQAQTYGNVEIIVVSDGSTDNTDAVAAEYTKADKRVSYYNYTPARGANYARNLGASKSNGKYIAFLDDDDAWHPDKAEKQYAAFKENIKVGLVTSGFHFIYVNQNSETNYIPKPSKDAAKEILIKNTIGGTPGVMVRRDEFIKAGGFDEEMMALQDYDMWVRTSQLCEVGVVNEPLTDVYDYFDKTKISNNTDRYIKAYERIECKYAKLIQCLTREENKARIYNFSMLIAKKGLRNQNRKVVFKYALSALKAKFSTTPLIIVLLSFLPYSIVLKVKNRLS